MARTKTRPDYRKKPAPAPQQTRFPVLPLLIGVVAVLGIVAVLVTRAGNDDGPETPPGVEQTRPVTVTGEALPQLEEGDDPAVGSTAPELEGAEFDGTPLTIGADGRAKVLVFLAHWCPHCQREVPILSEWLADNGAPDDVDILGIATSTSDERNNYPPSIWLDEEGFDVPTMADDVDVPAAQAFGLSAYPFFVAIDADNEVVSRTSGELTIEQWEALLGAARDSGASSGS